MTSSFKNQCGCGSRQAVHELGNEKCLRYILEKDEIPTNRRIETNVMQAWIWSVNKSWCTEYTLFNQRLYKKHKSGDWSRPKSKSSINSIKMTD